MPKPPAMRLILHLAIIASCALLISASASEPPREETKWYSFTDAVKLTQLDPRPIMIDVYTDWCGWCKRMDATTFRDSAVSEYLNTAFYAVKLDGESRDSFVFKGKTYKYVPNGRRGYNELAAALMNGRMSYPTVVMLNEKAEMIQPIAGYKQAREFEMILHYIGEGAYKGVKWETFQQEFKNR